MKKAKAPFLIALTVVLAASACLVTLPAPASMPSTLTPDLVSTGKAQTLTAAPTFTYTPTVILDTATPTLTLTSFPSITPLPTGTATFTATPLGFVASPTLGTPDLTPGTATPDPADGNTDERGSDYRCRLVDKDPATGTVLQSKSLYRVSWTLRNTGLKKWQVTDVVLVYLDGPRFEAEKKYGLNKDVKVGEDTRPAFTITVPKGPGDFRSVWALKYVKSDHIFCTFTINITVE
jgi:hypothetical protein